MKARKDERDAVIGASRVTAEGRRQLPCSVAFVLRDRHGISLKKIGEICDREDIRIVKCQLGCFR